MGFPKGLGSAAKLQALQTRLLFRTAHLAVSLKLGLFILASVVLILVVPTFFVPIAVLVWFFTDFVTKAIIITKEHL